MSKKPSVIELYNTIPDLIFHFMREAMITVPYDGHVILVCKDPDFVKKQFLRFMKKYPFEPVEVEENSVRYRPEETFEFGGLEPNDADYCFIVKSPCGFIEAVDE